MRRLVRVALLLYPRAVRHGHGGELEDLVEELIVREGRSRPAVIGRLAVDGLGQRLTSRTTAWVLAVSLGLTTVGGLAVSDFAAASAHQALPERHSVARTGSVAPTARAASLTVVHSRSHKARRARRGRLG